MLSLNTFPYTDSIQGSFHRQRITLILCSALFFIQWKVEKSYALIGQERFHIFPSIQIITESKLSIKWDTPLQKPYDLNKLYNIMSLFLYCISLNVFRVFCKLQFWVAIGCMHAIQKDLNWRLTKKKYCVKEQLWKLYLHFKHSLKNHLTEIN